MVQIREYIVNPGPNKRGVKVADAQKTLTEVIAPEIAEGKWQAATANHLYRAENTDIFHNIQLGDNPQALEIPYNMIDLAEKLEAALIMAGVLGRTKSPVYNGSVLYPPGTCTILVNKEGRAQLEKFIKEMPAPAQGRG